MVDDINNGNQSTLSAGHSDQHGGVPVQYEAHHPIWHAQGYSERHWTPPSGDCSLCIALAAARATINKTTMKNTPP
jgi:hypothetical protein